MACYTIFGQGDIKTYRQRAEPESNKDQKEIEYNMIECLGALASWVKISCREVCPTREGLLVLTSRGQFVPIVHCHAARLASQLQVNLEYLAAEHAVLLVALQHQTAF